MDLKDRFLPEQIELINLQISKQKKQSNDA